MVRRVFSLFLSAVEGLPVEVLQGPQRGAVQATAPAGPAPALVGPGGAAESQIARESNRGRTPDHNPAKKINKKHGFKKGEKTTGGGTDKRGPGFYFRGPLQERFHVLACGVRGGGRTCGGEIRCLCGGGGQQRALARTHARVRCGLIPACAWQACT